MFKIEKVESGENKTIKSSKYDLYSYTAYAGKHEIIVEEGDSLWNVSLTHGSVIRGDGIRKHNIDGMGIVIRGYRCEEKMSSFDTGSNLPYVNGCSSNQIFSPVRPGDPTMQLLYLPAFTQEQAHHIHSTVRAVLVIQGSGQSIQGMNSDTIVDLNVGDVLIMDKMTPHHFKTFESDLTVIPVHIFSSTVLEYNHPMKNGTFVVTE